MAVFSAKSGNVKRGGTPADVTDVVNINFEEVNEVQRYASSDTAGGYRRVAGLTDWTFSFDVLQDDTTPQTDTIQPGTSETLEVYENGTLKWSGTAMYERVGAAIPIETGGLVRYTVSGGANGTLTRP